MPETPSPRAELAPATLAEQPTVANLLELYAHDFSEFHPLDVGADGRFGYKPLPLYWSEPDRHPFLIRVDGRLAGLALIKRGSEISGRTAVWDMGEFFIVRACRRKGIGLTAACELWKRFPGPWEVRVMQSNRAALNFWQHAVQAFHGAALPPSRVQKEGTFWHVFAFDSETPSQIEPVG